MKRLATYTQHKILSHYWTERTPFTVNDLVRKGVLHFSALGRLTLRLMESRGQVLISGKLKEEILYIATTESKDEWADIWRNRCDPLNTRECFDGSMRGMNRYEREALLSELNELMEAYGKSNYIAG
jgi:hypothetical protein